MKSETRLKRGGALAIATVGGVGFFPFASGTVGTVVGCLFLWVWPEIPLWFHIGLILGLFFLGEWACGVVKQVFKKVDASPIVVDEVVGILITLLGVPLSGWWILFGFLVFRFFDIFKPPPADYFDQKVKNAWGVMLDDVVAGVYANIILRLVMRAQF